MCEYDDFSGVPVEAVRREERSIELEDDLARALDSGKKINEKTMDRPVTSYRCPRGCLLAVALKADDGEIYLAWKPGPSHRSVPIDQAGADAADKAREWREMQERYGVKEKEGAKTRWRTSSRSEVLDISKAGEMKPAEAARVSRYPADWEVPVSCRDVDAVLVLGDVPGDVAGPLRVVTLPRD